MFQISNLNL